MADMDAVWRRSTLVRGRPWLSGIRVGSYHIHDEVDVTTADHGNLQQCRIYLLRGDRPHGTGSDVAWHSSSIEYFSIGANAKRKTARKQ
jgi:hypothetical protein